MSKNVLLFLLLAIILSILIFLQSHTGSQFQKQSHRLQVATSFYPLYFLASRIAGDKAKVRNITPAGAEPHDYEPTVSDIAWIEQSKLLIINGAHLEVWYEKIKDQLQAYNVYVVMASEDSSTNRDPHVWLSPPLAKKEVARIIEGFIKVDPENTRYYQKNGKELLAQLDDLDMDYRKGLSYCQKNDIITSHNSFGYTAKTYGFHQISLIGISPDAEPSVQQLAQITQFAKKKKINYIFFETLVSPELSKTLAQEVGAQTLVLDPIEGISQEDMKKGKNYFTIMRSNLTNLRTALECK